MKLVLGTVQFGLPYGINNGDGIPSDTRLSALLETATEAEIDLLDTAYSYGTAEERLGQLASNAFGLITKFPIVHSGEELTAHFRESCERLKRSDLYAYLAHTAGTLIQSPDLWNDLQLLQQQHRIGKIGVSLYQPEELEQLLALGIEPQIVQLPYSLLDRKFEPYFAELKRLGTEIHTRSAFLQGLYFKSISELPPQLQQLAPALSELHRIAEMYHLDMETLALQFVAHHSSIDRIVVGVDTQTQLNHNVQSMNATVDPVVFDEIRGISIAHPTLLNPAVWHI